MCSPTGQVCLPFSRPSKNGRTPPVLQSSGSPAPQLSCCPVVVMVRLGETNQQINTLSKFVSRMRMRMPFATAAGAHCVSFPFSAGPRTPEQQQQQQQPTSTVQKFVFQFRKWYLSSGRHTLLLLAPFFTTPLLGFWICIAQQELPASRLEQTKPNQNEPLQS